MAYFGQQKRDYNNARRAEWRVRVLAHLGGKCVKCGSMEKLEIHHKDPATKKYNISAIWCHRWAKQLGELKKCELRCSQHHKEFHASPHASHERYRKGCRCDLCVTFYRAVKREYMADYRAKGMDSTRSNYTGG